MLHLYSDTGMHTMILPYDGEKNSVEQQVKDQQVYEASASSTLMDTQSICFAVELFLIVSVDVHTPNIH